MGWTEEEKRKIMQKISPWLNQDKRLIRSGKIKLKPVVRHGLRASDREITGFNKIKSRNPVCSKCKIEMEFIKGDKYGCRICYDVIGTTKIEENDVIIKPKTKEEILENNRQKFARASYTGKRTRYV